MIVPRGRLPRICRALDRCNDKRSSRNIGTNISTPCDQYEQGADRVANAVMHREQESSAGLSQTQTTHRQVPENEEEMMQAKYRDDKIRRQVKEEEEKPL
jgi:hypothetical protein